MSATHTEPASGIETAGGGASPPAAAGVTGAPVGRAELAERLMSKLLQKVETGSPEEVRAYVEAAVRLIEASGAGTSRERAEAERRQLGMWLGAVMATVFVAGGVYLGLSEKTPALLSLILLCVGAACAGATFAVVTGKDARAGESSAVLAALLKTPDAEARREDGT